MNRRSRARLLFACSALAMLQLACAKKQELVVQTRPDKALTADEIDRNPAALLPGGAIGIFYIDAQRTFASEFGRKLLKLATRHLPLPPSAGFDPERDLQHVYIGSYSMQGIDVASVLTGQFDPEKIEKAADGVQQTPLGVPVVKSSYAGRSLYTARNVGFVVLTRRTVLAGNETGIRRALDRIQEGRVTSELPSWMRKLLSTPNAVLVGGADFRAHPVSASIRRQMPFLNGLDSIQGLGNFEAPGVNLAGTLGYADPAAAQSGAEALLQLQRTLQNYSFLMAIIGIGQPIQKLEVQVRGKDAEFVVGLDGQAVSRLLDKAQELLNRLPAQQTVPASAAPSISP